MELCGGLNYRYLGESSKIKSPIKQGKVMENVFLFSRQYFRCDCNALSHSLYEYCLRTDANNQ